jgi:hypothetical protein
MLLTAIGLSTIRGFLFNILVSDRSVSSIRPEAIRNVRSAPGSEEDKPSHFGDVMLTGKLHSPMFVQIENFEHYHNRTEYATNGPQLHHKQSC